MDDIRISDLPATAACKINDLFPVTQAVGGTKKVTLDQILAFAAGDGRLLIPSRIWADHGTVASSQSVASGSDVALTPITAAIKGLAIVIVRVNFASNATGLRSLTVGDTTVNCAALNGVTTRLEAVEIIRTPTNTIPVTVRQTSGGNLNVSGGYAVIAFDV